MTPAQKKAFIGKVYGQYETSGRHDLPWRKTAKPYRIIVSELMLQQTQVPRVIEKYREFLAAFPTVEALAAAPLQQVLFHWSGLGYNRRARFLHQMAKAVVKEQGGKFPRTHDGLLALPGIGRYTAGAVCAFAYNMAVPIIETNIRTAYLHHFFPDTEKQVGDAELLPLIADTLDRQHPRQWYWALMDYGAQLKKNGVRIHRNSAHYKKQPAFGGSLRQARGAIVKVLSRQPASEARLQRLTGIAPERIAAAIQALSSEQLITKKRSMFSIE